MIENNEQLPKDSPGPEAPKDDLLISVCLLDDDSPLLLSSLMAVLKALERAPGTAVEIGVYSRSSAVSFSLDEVVKRFPDLRIVVLPWHTHRVDMLNYALRRSSGRFVLFLNSDIILDRDFFTRFLPYAGKLNLFSLAFDVRTVHDPVVFQTAGMEDDLIPSGDSFELGKTSFSGDLLGIDLKPGLPADAPSLFTFSGAGCFRRDALLQMDGFNGKYKFAGYGFCADLDLCYRAWESGYGTLYAPELKVWHCGLSNAGAFYSALPVADHEPFFDRFAWNVLYKLFLIRHGLPVKIGAFLAGVFKNLGVLDLLTLLIALLIRLFQPGKKRSLKPVYGFDKIREITSRDVL